MCEECLRKYEVEMEEKCPKCGRQAEDCSCGADVYSRGYLGGRASLALVFYKGYSAESDRVTEKLLFKLKRKFDRPLINFFARDISSRLMKLKIIEHCSTEELLLTFPPRSAENAAKYGFDHAEELTLRVSYYTGIPFRRLLGRENGSEQKTLTSDERFENASCSLYVKDRNGARGKRIILLDDIITTGATACASAELLLAAGAKSVFPASIAKTVRKHNG